jgi:cation diffusion facilitator CzcD-associated flavoprotein CzcO
VRAADVVVIGAGQAGLSAAYHLARRGFMPAQRTTTGTDTGGQSGRTYAVLDAEDGPGGAWRHRWKSLRMATVNGISDLPGVPQPDVDPAEPSSAFLTRYFAGYERELGIAVERPVKALAVEREDADPAGRLRITTSDGGWSARAVINATGTWTRPFWPIYPGQFTFKGRQLHVADYVSAEEFRGLHVIVVGGGISAVALVEDRVRRGLPPQSIVSATGLIWTPALRAAAARGVLERRPMFTGIEPDGVRLADGSLLAADVILWATGFRAELEHLAPLHLRGPGGGIAMDGTRVAAEPRVHLVGYGPSSSTIGANRAGRAAVAELLKLLDAQHA